MLDEYNTYTVKYKLTTDEDVSHLNMDKISYSIDETIKVYFENFENVVSASDAWAKVRKKTTPAYIDGFVNVFHIDDISIDKNALFYNIRNQIPIDKVCLEISYKKNKVQYKHK